MMKKAAGGFIAVLLFLLGPHSLRAQDVAVSPEAPSNTARAVVPAGEKFIMELDTDLHTRTTRKGERVSFKTAADITADHRTVIPTGALVRATVTKCKRAGRLVGNAEINLRFDEILLPNGKPVPLRATITRVGFDAVDHDKDGDSKIKGEPGSGGDAETIVKAGAQGAIIGVMSAGGKGAIYGSAAGAAIAAAGMLFRRGPDIDLPRKTLLEARLDTPLEIPSDVLPLAAQAPRQEAAAASVTVPPPVESSSEGAAPTDAKRPVLKRRQASEPSESTAPPAAESGVADSEPGISGAPDVSSPSEPEIPNEDVAILETPASTVPEVKSLPSKGMPPAASTAAADFRVKVQMVLVDAVVKDAAGRLIDNLTQDDFRVYEDGVLQQLQSFSIDELPLAVAIVVDRSGSVAPYISELRRIATRTLQQLKPADQVALFSFAGTVDRLEDLTTDRQRIADGISRIQAGGGTNILDALFQAASYLGKAAPDRRHAVILVSDNQSTVSSRASEGEVIREAMETDTVLYSIETRGASNPLAINLPELIFGGDQVERIAKETGGELLKASRVSSLDTVLGSVIARLRKRYSLGYYPPAASGGAFHAIQVRLDEKHGRPGKDYFVHARKGYYSTAGRSR